MYNVSKEFLQSMSKPAQKRSCTGKIGDIDITEKNIVQGSTTITNQCSGNSEIQIGQVYIGELKITLKGLDIPRREYRGKEITLTQWLLVDVEDTQQWQPVPLGHFFVDNAEITVQGVSLTAHDAMSKFDKYIFGQFPDTGYPWDFIRLACYNCGVSFGMTNEEFDSLTNSGSFLTYYTENDIETWRDCLSWIAQTMGANALIDRDGKLIFRSYVSSHHDEYGVKRRLEGGSFSDFDSYYTGVSFVDIASQKTSYYGLSEDTGLTMNLGSNPFLQSVTELYEFFRNNVLIAVSGIDYTPCKVRINACMIYDLMDVLLFTGGIIGGDITTCITKFTWRLNGDYTIECSGKDPYLSSAKSKTDKNISGLLSQIEENEMHYYYVINPSNKLIKNGNNIKMINIKYAVKKDTDINFHCEICYEMNTFVEETLGVTNLYDGKIKVTYYIDNDEVVEYHPIETNTDGEHLMHLLFSWKGKENTIGYFTVYIQTTNCDVLIKKYNLRGYIEGWGLVGEGVWDGTIDVEEEVGKFGITTNTFTESAKVRLIPPIRNNTKEELGSFNLSVKQFTDSVESPTINKDIMVFSTIVNISLLSYTANIVNGSFTNGQIITTKVYNVEGVDVISYGAAYYASFDDGVTWLAYSQGAWVKDASMTAEEITSVPKDSWPDTVMIKVVLDSESTLTQLVLKGGYIQ